jgi:flavin reductase (DIM6/NTAB) family NADH-FMN oxidoreductase RutF
MLRVKKVDISDEKDYDKICTPVSSLAMITTVDAAGRVNAATFATVVRNCHTPTCFEFSVDTFKHTWQNVTATQEFVINVPSCDPWILEKVVTVGLDFPPGVNELEKAGLTEIASKVVKPPRIAECKSHFECKVEWTKNWIGTRSLVVGRVVAASIDEDCIDEHGFAIHEKLRPAHSCGGVFGFNRFVEAYKVIEVPFVYVGTDYTPRDTH